MIEKPEIDIKADELGVHVSHVQRDYVFGWLLAALYQPDNPLHHLLILKGGNCFRKAYFERARYSNDLDFSIQSELDLNLFVNALRQACVFANTRSGVEFLVDESRLSEKKLADSESQIYEARVYFKSFYGEEDARIRVNLDVKEYDRIFLPIQTQHLIHSYSDASLCEANIRCVKLEELLASKLKALLQRRHSPDLYDFVHAIFFQKSLQISRSEVLSVFLKQTIYEPSPLAAKNLLLELPFQAIRGFWNEYLVCPKASLFSFDDAEIWFKTVIGEIFGLTQPQYAFAGGPYRAQIDYFPAKFRDVIMESGRLQHLVKLVYEGLERKVEPYALSFKRRRDGVGREYFYAWDQSGGRSGQIGIKSYTADKVQTVVMTDEKFEPRFPIELTKAGEYFGKPHFSSPRPRMASPRRSSARSPFSVAYVLECPYCGKKFKRSKHDTKLNEHKDKYGNRCYGRIGFITRDY